MLVLTQKEGEVLQLGDDIRIYIKRVKGNMVRLCIDAPREVAIVRVPATPVRRPLNRATAQDDSEGAPQADLELRPAGEGLSHGEGEYPTEEGASAREIDDSDAPVPDLTDTTEAD